MMESGVVQAGGQATTSHALSSSTDVAIDLEAGQVTRSFSCEIPCGRSRLQSSN